MSRRDDYPTGVPCWVERLSPDVEATKRFYATIFGWEFAGPGPMPGDPPGEYFVAQLRRSRRGRNREPPGGRGGGGGRVEHPRCRRQRR